MSDTVSEESHAKATSMTYALECAAWSLNKGRGTNFSDEATYMFISHYIDRPEYYWSNNNNAFLLDGLTLSEDSQYYAKWITDDDRAAYRIYMNNGKISTVFETVRTVYSGCQTLIGNTNILRNITMDINSMKKTLNLAKVTYITYDNIMALQDSRESVKTVYTALKSSPTKLSVLYEQLIEDDNIFRNADQTIRNQLISNTLSMFGGFLLGGVIGVLDSLRSGLLNCVIDYYIDLIDLAAYASMRYSFHGRLANRTYDYIMDNYM